MAQLERNRKSVETSSSKTPKGERSPTFQQLLQGDVAWQFSTSPTPCRTPDHEGDLSPYNRKSMFTKVKEKAKKLRQSLSMKKRHENENLDSHCGTPSWGVSLDDEDDDQVDEDPEYFGAPMYESELAPESLKESARQHPRANPLFSHNHVLLTPTGVKHEEEGPKISSKIAGLTVSVPEKQADPKMEHFAPNRSSETGEHVASKSPQKWDKGVSVKEYFMNKLEPGEDDKALSQVISDAISPTKKTASSGGDMGVVDKVREAVTSFLRPEEPSQFSPNNSASHPSRETMEATNLSSYSPSPTIATTRNKASSPNSSSSSRSTTSMAPTKITSPSSSTAKKSSKTESLSPKAIPKNEKPYVPISLSSSCADEPPSRQISKGKSLLVNHPVSTERKNMTQNSTSSISYRAQTANSSGEHSNSKVTVKVPNSSTNTTAVSSNSAGVQQPNFVLSTRPNGSSSMPISRSKSLSVHMPVPNVATSSPLIPVSTNAQEVAEEQAHGRILQAN